MIPCNSCGQHYVAKLDKCPNCDAPTHPNEIQAWGYQYKSTATLFGVPMLHVSFAFKNNGTPIPARGIIAIGQFATGVISIAQFGIGVICFSQFALGVYALAQVAMAYELIAQAGLYIHSGTGQAVGSFSDFVELIKGLFQ